MGRTLSLADHVDEIPLAPPRARGGALGRLFGFAHRRGPGAGTLRATDSALLLSAPGLENGVEISWAEVRKLAVDDGIRWGYVSGVCRFPVYDRRSDGSGSGVLIGPLWSNAGSLMPEGCPARELEPVPAEPPNVAVIFDPPLALPAAERRNGAAADAESIAVLLLRAEDPEVAREALSTRHTLAEIGHEDLEYLMQETRRPRHRRRSVSEQRASA